MYKTVKGLYRKGKIVSMEPVDLNQDEIEVMITFLLEENIENKIKSSADDILYTIGERALEGKHTDVSEKHDDYLYGGEK